MPRYESDVRDRSPLGRGNHRMKSPEDLRGRISGGHRSRDIRDPSPIMPRGPRESYDDYHGRSMKVEREPVPYKILCLANLNQKVADSVIREAILREFGKFGELSVKVTHDGIERLAYLYFRSYKDAREARHSKRGMLLFDKPLDILPIPDRSPSSSSSRPRGRSPTPEYGPPLPPSSRPSVMRPSPPPRRPPPIPIRGHKDYSPHHAPSLSHHPPPPPPHTNRMHSSQHRDLPMPRDTRNGSSMHHSYNSSHRGPPPPPPLQNHHSRAPAPGTVRESKKEKFPNYLHHIEPADDPNATRTLFVGNLEVTIQEADIRRIFEKYGVIEDIDVKRPPPGQGNAYAFLRYNNLDQAHRAKVEMSGQYLGKFQMKIGYGKALPTTRIWVGGLGSWVGLDQLEREFDRFGAIRKIEYVKGDDHAYIQFCSQEAAKEACRVMRGFSFPNAEKRLRVDFADEVEAPPIGEYDTVNSTQSSAQSSSPPGAPAIVNATSEQPTKTPPQTTPGDSSPRRVDVNDAADLKAIISSSVVNVWNGALILKNSTFTARMCYCDGDPSLLQLIKGQSQMTITQRLALDASKLQDLSRKIDVAHDKGGYCMLLTLASAANDLAANSAKPQHRPIRHLVTYLKAKQAAGVISLSSEKDDQPQGDSVVAGLMYIFPPCQFSLDQLRRKKAPNLTQDLINRDDHLLVIILKKE